MAQKHYILCLVGKSGTGKTTISRLMADSGIPTVVSYTTRPMRNGERQGVDHWFVTEDVVDHSMTLTDAMRAAYTEFGGFRYFATFDQFLLDRIQTYVVDEAGLVMLHDKLSQYEQQQSSHQFVIVPIYVMADSEVVSARTDIDRSLRDSHRLTFALDAYDIIIHNDAQDLSVLSDWCKGFSIAIRALCTDDFRVMKQPVHVHTNDKEIACIINQLSGVQFYS